MTFLLEPVKNGRTLPGTCLDHALSAFGQNAGNILKQSAAGDVGHAFNGHALHGFKNRLDVDACRFHNGVCQSLSVGKLGCPGFAGNFNNFAD